MSVGNETKRERHMESGVPDASATRPVWRAPCIQILSLSETRNGGNGATDSYVFKSVPSGS